LVKTGGAAVVDETITGFVHLWDMTAGKEVGQFRCVRSYPKSTGIRPGERAPPRCPPDFVTLSPDGRTLVAIVYGGGLWVWDVATGKQLCHQPAFKGSYDGTFLCGPDARTLFSASTGKKGIDLWETATGFSRGLVRLRHAEAYTSALAVSP